jgi:hypothetical protein
VSFQLGAEQPVMPPQPQAIRHVQDHALEQVQKVLGELRLFVQRVQLTSHDSSGGVRFSGHVLAVKRFVFPPDIDAGENLAWLASRDDLQERAAAIALEIFAVRLDKRVFVRRRAGTGPGTDMHAPHLALGDFRTQGE